MLLGCLLACLALSPEAILAADPSTPKIVPADPTAAGQELVTRLLSLRPTESVTNQAVLRVEVKKTKQFELPLRIGVTVDETNWVTTYGTDETIKDRADRFSVTRTAEGSNIYRRATRAEAAGGTNGWEIVPNEQAFVPFAGSDFWLADLGMEFLHWPTQRLLSKELCRGQSCDKLESVAPATHTNGYVQVISWFDIDTGGPVLIQAYDAKGTMVKEFKPNVFTKVNGQWEVEEIQITDPRTKVVSYLNFHLKGK